jgi:hypothetical protein
MLSFLFWLILKVEIEGSQPILHLPYIGLINKDKKGKPTKVKGYGLPISIYVYSHIIIPSKKCSMITIKHLLMIKDSSMKFKIFL